MRGTRGLNSSDAAVQKTNDDAQASKASCVKCGYFNDEFLQYFVRRGIERRAPLINRGYFARVAALKQLLKDFLSIESNQGKQIISLGAGFDTTYFHLQASSQDVAKYIELDFVEVTRKKARTIASHPQLHELIPGFSQEAWDRDTGKMVGGTYALLPGDLRETDKIMSSLEEAGIDWTAPTLIIAECVLVYVPADSSQSLVTQLGSRLQSAAFIVYEQICPYDAFGQQMMVNIERRGCPLMGIHGTPDLASQCKRFTEHGWSTAWAIDMDDIYKYLVPVDERRRVERLEPFDEFEEWNLLQKHYCIVVGAKDILGVFPNSLTQCPKQRSNERQNNTQHFQ